MPIDDRAQPGRHATFWDYPNKQASILSYDAGLILVVMVLVLLVAARLIIARTQRHAEGRAG